jgi:mRNA interferase RelE/StbE
MKLDNITNYNHNITNSYSVVIKRQVKKKLLLLSRKDRVRIAEKIELLGCNPNNPLLDIKKLTGEPYYRLRIGDWRIIFDRQDEIKVVAIEKLDARGGIYK